MNHSQTPQQKPSPSKRRISTLAALTVALCVVVPITAQATPPEPDASISEVVDNAIQRAAGPEAAVAVSAEVSGDQLQHEGAGFTLAADLDGSNKISLNLESQEVGQEGTVLPLMLQTDNAVGDRVYADDLLTAPAEDSAQTVVQLTETGVRIMHLLEGPKSPTRFATKLEADKPIDPVFYDETGQVFLHDTDGVFLGEIEPAWAIDAEGRAVPTRYTWEEGHLVQHVDHTSGDFTYPIVADPTWTYSFTFSDPDYGEGITVEKAMKELRRCFNCSFPIAGAPKAFPKLNQIIALNASPFSIKNIPYINAKVKVTATAWRTWKFTAEPGHFDGAGSTVTFAWYQTCTSLKKPRIHMNVGAVIKKDLGAGNAAVKTAAAWKWGLFVSNTYYNAIKYQGATNRC